MIEIKNICKEYNGNVILKDVNTTINEGDVVAIIGPSGCGKSTFLNCINVLNRATSGQIILNGVDIMAPACDLQKYRKKLGMVFQSFNLFGHLTVLENVINPQKTLLRRSRKEAYEKALNYLSLVGMADKMMSYPDQLSGGQKQRVAIARTLAMDPEVILLDEPTSALDPTMVGEVEYVIKKLAKQGRTMIIVTHELRLAREISNRVFYMDEKNIYEEGPTEKIFTNPEREKTRQFIERARISEIIITSPYYDYIEGMKQLEEYGDKLSFDPKLIQKMQLLFEEACIQTVMPQLMPEPHIRAVFEYIERKQQLTFTIYHPGKEMLNSENESLQQMIINKLANDIKIKEVLV